MRLHPVQPKPTLWLNEFGLLLALLGSALALVVLVSLFTATAR